MSSLPAPIHFWHIQIDFGKSGQQKKNNMCNAIFEDQIQPTSDLIWVKSCVLCIVHTKHSTYLQYVKDATQN